MSVVEYALEVEGQAHTQWKRFSAVRKADTGIKVRAFGFLCDWKKWPQHKMSLLTSSNAFKKNSYVPEQYISHSFPFLFYLYLTSQVS